MTKDASHVVATRVFVRGLEVQAEIGVYPHELGAPQPLIVDIELEVDAAGWRHLDETVNYETLARHAVTIARGGHIGLVDSSPSAWPRLAWPSRARSPSASGWKSPWPWRPTPRPPAWRSSPVRRRLAPPQRSKSHVRRLRAQPPAAGAAAGDRSASHRRDP